MELLSLLQDIYDHKVTEEEGLFLLKKCMDEEEDAVISPKESVKPIDVTLLLKENKLGELLENQLQTIFMKHLLLNQEQLTKKTFFSSIGVDSISVSSIMTDMKALYPLNIPITTLLEYENIEAFSKFLVEHHSPEIIQALQKKADQSQVLSESCLQEPPISQQGSPLTSPVPSDETGMLALWNIAEQESVDEVPQENILKTPNQTLKLLKGASAILLTMDSGSVFEFIVGGFGPPILLICGLNTDARLWSYQFQTLKETHRVICYHPPGHGKSTLNLQDTSFQAIGISLHAALAALNVGPSLQIVGWSMGGCIAEEYAVLYPDEVQQLTLVNATPYSVETPLFFGTLIKELMTHKNAAEFAERLDLEKDFLGPDVMKYYKQLFAGWTIESKLKDIQCRVCVISGKQDHYIEAKCGKDIADRVNISDYECLEDAGHFIPLTHPDVLNRLDR